MDLSSLFINVLAAALFLAVIGLCIFLILPVASIAANAKEKAWTLAVFAILGFIPFWLANGFGFLQDLFRGNVFQAAYWESGWHFTVSLAAIGTSIWVAVSWLLYWLGLCFMGLLTIVALGSAMGPKSVPVRIGVFGLFCLTAYSGYLWGHSGKEWLISIFA